MRARQLEVFVAVMRAGSITAAARMLNISQPALSQVLLHAEDELGFALFTREKGRLHPTPEALELLPDAERLFGGLEGLRRKTADLRQGRAGLVRIAASPPPAMSFLPGVLAAYRKAHPDILVRAHVAPVASLITMLRAGDAMLALALDDTMPPDIDVEPLGGTRFTCLLPPDHPFVDRDGLRLADLQDQALISYRAATRPHHELSQAARAQGLRFEPILEIDMSITAVGFVQAGLGIAVVDSLLPWAQFAGIRQCPLLDEVALPLSLLTLKGRVLSRAESLMRDTIRKHKSDL
ncbi:LysR family transcriptional regulator [Paracoccus sp. TOH]|uniref:LysR family transcriptional regulator n=1 Tax=Paracoccus sp. TOH TaxID=1263728 RepID=UPI0025AF5C2E|nr:LysR family transcriptional regulator [Paracoccus sp. TOH]WJS85393.1 LysR family transcriptional regulator [Paracoccus sp. TOH]